MIQKNKTTQGLFKLTATVWTVQQHFITTYTKKSDETCPFNVKIKRIKQETDSKKKMKKQVLSVTMLRTIQIKITIELLHYF